MCSDGIRLMLALLLQGKQSITAYHCLELMVHSTLLWPLRERLRDVCIDLFIVMMIQTKKRMLLPKRAHLSDSAPENSNQNASLSNNDNASNLQNAQGNVCLSSDGQQLTVSKMCRRRVANCASLSA